MADKKISQLTDATTLTGAELLPMVQIGSTVKTTVQGLVGKMVTVSKTATAGESVDLDSSTYANAQMVKLTWSGASGTDLTHYLLQVTAQIECVRFISDSTFASKHARRHHACKWR